MTNNDRTSWDEVSAELDESPTLDPERRDALRKLVGTSVCTTPGILTLLLSNRASAQSVGVPPPPPG